MRRTAVRVLGVVVVVLFAATAGWAWAQEKPTQDKEKKDSVAAADPLSGQWDGTVETQEGTIAFGLSIKLEKDKVSGEIASEQGSTPVAGSWADGKLSLTFDYNGTPVSMSGGLKDEALSGEMNFGGGQMVMSWTAKKRKA